MSLITETPILTPVVNNDGVCIFYMDSLGNEWLCQRELRLLFNLNKRSPIKMYLTDTQVRGSYEVRFADSDFDSELFHTDKWWNFSLTDHMRDFIEANVPSLVGPLYIYVEEYE